MNWDYVNACVINKAWVRDRALKFFGQFNDKEKAPSLAEWIERYIEKVPTLVKKNKEAPLSRNTIKGYKTTLGKIKAFEEYKNTRLQFTDINLSFHKDFINYLSKVESLGGSTIGAIIKNLKVFCRIARLDGHRVHEEVNHPEFFTFTKASFAKSESVYLNDEEIDRIYKLNLSHSESLENVRHCAIVGLRTGLRVSDFMKLDAKNIKGDYIEVQTQKRGHRVVIPLHPQLKEVLEKTGGLPKKNI